MSTRDAGPSRVTLRSTAFGSPSGLLAFGFGSGLAPLAPGTAGTAAAIPFAVALKLLDPLWLWIALVALFTLGVWCCGRASERLGAHDHGGIVWDEMVGYWLAVALAPPGWQWLLAGFVLFRFFDIFKPWPIRQLDRRAGGGLGIMADDAIAGLYTLIVLLALEYLAGYWVR